MIHLTSTQRCVCVPVSLWQGTELLGWFRAKDIGDKGMLVTGPVEILAENNIVTVAIELKQRDAISTLTVKAMVMGSTYSGKELWWVDQQVGLRPLIAEFAQQFA